MPLDISTTKHWHSRGIPYISITSQFCDECTLGITCHTCKRVDELHHCVEAMLEYYDVTFNLELCPWFTRCLIVKLLRHHPTPKSIKRFMASRCGGFMVLELKNPIILLQGPKGL
jgi:hypothetical protein